MRRYDRISGLGLLLLLLAACGRQQGIAPADPPGARRIEAHVRFLADDLLEGRQAGTRGFDLASLYVATQFRALGLEAAGDNGSYFQNVPLVQGERIAEGARLEVERDGKHTALKFETDFLPNIVYSDPNPTVTAPMVFVAQAVSAPELQHDDFASVDVRGKVAVIFGNAPPTFSNDQRAYYTWRMEKSRQLVAHGAIGVIYVDDPRDEAKRPWERGAKNWRAPGMRLLDASNKPVDDFPELRGSAVVRSGAADVLFEGSGHSAAEVFKLLEQGKLTSFPLTGTVTLAQASSFTELLSRNVVAKWPGSDAKLAAEHVVFSAHLDHLGIGAEVGGDTIYNGALDNALGIGIMLEAAQRFVAQAERPHRSILFLAVTGEEKGLLGSDQFTRHPTVPFESLVADVNMDMPILLQAQRDVVPIGIEHSSVRPLVERATRALGLALSPDPFPEETVFVRSDQLSFIKRGIPSVYLDGGVLALEPGVDVLAADREFLKNHYHLPSDDANQPIHYPSAARLAALNQLIGMEIANQAERPRWNDGDFFGEKFGKKP
jgi:Zn-dependent M28 family amino/carboxypeptidase